MKINILHFSDFHYSNEYCDQCRLIGERLAESTVGMPIDAVIFSGDLVQDVGGDFEQAYKALIEPVSRVHGLTMDRILIVPGNHDKRKLGITDPLVEKLLISKAEEQVNAYYSNPKLTQASMADFEHFNAFHRNRYGYTGFSGFGRASVFNLSGIKVGMVGLNSAWCSTYSAHDRGNLLFPLNVAERIFEKTQDCDIVLTSMHHNLNDFKFFIASKLEDLIQENSHLLLTGHYHKQTLNATLTPKGCLLHNVAPATFDKHENSSTYGYCVITVNTETHEVESSIYQYDGHEFKQEEHLKTTAMMSERKRKLYDLRKTMQRHLGMLEVMADSLIPTDAQQKKGFFFEQLYANPILVETGLKGLVLSLSGNSIPLKNVEEASEDVVVITTRKKERMSLLFKIWMDFLRHYDVRNTIPFYIDCTRYREQKDFFSIEQQLQQFMGQTSSEMTRTFQNKRLLLLLDDFDMGNKVFLNALEHSITHIPGARFIACVRADFVGSFGKLQFHDRRIRRLFLKGFKQV